MSFDLEPPSCAVILLAAGRSTRFAGAGTGGLFEKKPFAPLAGKSVWLHSLEKFRGMPFVRQIVLVVGACDEPLVRREFQAEIRTNEIVVAVGGAERFDSVAAGLACIDSTCQLVALHDAARPLVSSAEIRAVCQDAARYGAAILAAPVRATLKRVDVSGHIEATVSRDALWEAQTPQVFERELILAAYTARGDIPSTDDAQLVERLGRKVHITPASNLNFKITTQDDLLLAERAVGLRA